MDLSVALLAGGASRRFGSDKTLAAFRGKPLIAHLAEKARKYTEDLLVLSKTPLKYEFLSARSLPDKFDKQCPLNGIITALEEARHDKVFAIAADTPLFPFNALKDMLSHLDSGGFDATLPLIHSKVYPCAALYAKRTLPALRSAFEQGDYRLTKAIERLNVKYLDEAFFLNFCRPKRAFVNANTKEDLNALNPPIAAFAGYSDSGKTTIVTKVIAALNSLGYKVASIKHDGSLHPLYEGDKDSHKHKAAGAAVSVALNTLGFELIADTKESLSPIDFLPLFPEDTDIVIAEGFKNSCFPKIEVVRDNTPRLEAQNIIGEIRAEDDPAGIVRLLVERFL